MLLACVDERLVARGSLRNDLARLQWKRSLRARVELVNDIVGARAAPE